MIVTVTINPAVDKTASIDKISVHALNRLTNIEWDAGGKGINVSKTIAALGGRSVATGFLAGSNGAAITACLNNVNGIQPDFIAIPGETRTNLKIVEANGSLTEFNAPGAEIPAPALAQLRQKILAYAAPGTLFVMGGSIGKGCSPDIYRTLIEAVHKKGAKVILDADGEAFSLSLAALPDVLKPNAFELCQYFQVAEPPRGEYSVLAKLGLLLNKRGVGTVCISLGKDGALFIQNGRVLRAPGLSVNCCSSVGAGDAMVAAIAYGMDHELSAEDFFRLAIAASAAACTTVGTKSASLQTVNALLDKVCLLPFEQSH